MGIDFQLINREYTVPISRNERILSELSGASKDRTKSDHPIHIDEWSSCLPGVVNSSIQRGPYFDFNECPVVMGENHSVFTPPAYH